MTLQGRVVAISGASRGLGAAIAQACARQGADLMLGARDAAALEGVRQRSAGLAPGIRAEAQVLDVADEASVGAFAAATRARLGGCDVLVNNAGVYGPKGRLEDVAWQAWEQALRVNLCGVVLPCVLCVAGARAGCLFEGFIRAQIEKLREDFPAFGR